MNPLYTIGHSDHIAGQVVSLLRVHGIKAVVDVRSNPYSQRMPHFNRGIFDGTLKAARIHYVFLGRELGARREEPECYIEGRADYALIARTPAFKEGLNRLLQGLKKMPVALLCAEHDPLTCHRMLLVCRHLRTECPDIQHILRDSTLESNHQAELRLMREMGSGTDLVTPSIIEHAYDFRGRQIAYSDDCVELETHEEQKEMHL